MSNKSPILEDFGKIIKRLEKVLELKKTEVVRDSAIKRFELCFDLAWKSIKVYAKNQGVECYSPRACFKEAFRLKLIEYDEQWLNMIKDRNVSARLYEEGQADRIYSKLPNYSELFKKLFLKLNE